MRIEILNLEGLTFVFSPIKDIETASLGIFLKVGSRYEKKSQKGIAHFLEHLIFKGSKNYSYLQIKREIEGRGGYLNGFTSQESTGYYARFLNKNSKITLNILLDMVFWPLLKEKDIEKKRNVILEEIKMYNDLPSSRALSLLEKLLWPDHPLGEDIIGNFSTVKRINKKNLLDFKNTYYLPSNCIISFSGDFDKEKVIRWIRKRIEKSKLQVKLKTYPPRHLSGLRIKVEKKNLHQVHLCFGFRGVSYFDKNRFCVEILNVILGANMSSRLFEALREKRGLCYEISTEARKYKDSGAFIIHLGLDKEKIEEATKVIVKELKRIKEKPVSLKELIRAKDYFLGQLLQSLEKPEARSFYLAESLLTLGRIYTLEEIKKELEKINPLRLKKIAQNIFNLNNLCISCVGDIEEKIEDDLRKIVLNC
jgi:predicted Zn-dependent peptidase